MKRVLYLAQIFPPSGGAGVLRTQKFVRYLPDYGWQPKVLTSDRIFEPRDDTLSSEVAASPQRRVRGWGPPEAWRSSRLRRAHRLWSWLSIPDEGVWWARRASRVAAQWHREEPFDAIVATGGPFSTLLAGVWTKRRIDVPLVVDLRDPWTGNPRRFPRSWHVVWRDPLERGWERRCLQGADAVVCVNREMTELLACTPRGRLEIIENGFDPEDFSGVATQGPEELTESFGFGYVGSVLDEFRLDEWFFPAFRKTAAQLPVRLDWVGESSGIASEASHALRLLGPRPHGQAVAAMEGSSALLLFSGGQEHDLSSKVFEYLASGRPILAFVSPDSAAARLLHGHRQTYVVPPFDEAAAAAALEQVVRTSSPCERDVASLSRQQRTKDLAGLLDRLVAA